MIYFLSFFLSLNLWALTDCEIKFGDIIVFQKNAHLNNYNNIYDEFKNSTCPHNILKFAVDSLLQQNGKVSTRHLRTLINDEFSEANVKIYPEEIIVSEFTNFIKEKLNLDDGFDVQNLKILSNKNILQVQELDQVSVECQNCTTAGDKNFRIILNNQNIWFSMKLMLKTNIYMASEDISPNDQNILSDKIKSNFIFTENPSQYVSSSEDLRFYRTNKKIQKNTPIKNMDLLPITLVNNGQLTKIYYDENGIKLNGSAIAKKSGTFGQTIELYNPKNKKLILGKIIDFNTVKIEL